PGTYVGPGGGDEAHGPRLPADRGRQGRPVLLQGEVEDRALERPPAVVPRGLHRGRRREQVAAVERGRGRAHGVLSGDRQILGEAVMVGTGVGDVLTASLQAV